MGRSLEAKGRIALSCLFLLACSAALEVPVDADIVCARDADCPETRICQVVVGRCIDPTIIDAEPPVLLSASALDSTVLMLDFSERIDPGSMSASRIIITPSLPVDETVVQPSLRQVRVTTGVQEPGFEYLVEVREVADLAGNAIADGSSQTFNGFGAGPDRSPPSILAPRGGTPLTVEEVTLIWTRRALALSYTVEVAYDPSFTQLVPGFPATVDDPDNSLTRTFDLPVRYYWRVRANTTSAGVYGEGRFDRLGREVHVYCAAGATCLEVDGEGNPLPGNISAPLGTIAGGVRLAQALGLPSIRLAARGAGEAYRERVLLGTLSLYGGYDATFSDSSRDREANPTVIESDDAAALFIFGSSVQQTVEGLELRSSNAPALAAAGAQTLHIIDNVVRSSIVGIEASGVSDLLVSGNTLQSLPASNGAGMRITSSVAVVQGNTVVVEPCGAGPCGDPIGVDTHLGSLFVWDNDITVASSGGELDHIGLRARDCVVDAQRNRLTVGDGSGAALQIIVNSSLGQSLIRNNILVTGATLDAFGVTYGLLATDSELATAESPFLAVANNLIYAGGGPGTAMAVSDGLVGSIYVNNIMATGPGAVRYCLSETWADNKIANFRNNLLLECPTALYRDISDLGEANRTAIDDVNLEANTTQNGVAGSVAGNITAASLLGVGFAGFPTDVRLTAASPANVRLGGTDASQVACGPGGFYACGGLPTDFVSAARTCPTEGSNCYSIGPFESDP